MTEYTLSAEVCPPDEPRSVALGIFDGVHIGHRAVLSAALYAGNGRCAVYTFDPATMDTKPDSSLLCTADEQRRLLEQNGVREVFVADFASVRHLSPEEFVRDELCKRLHCVAATCGDNFRFGAGGIGDADTLRALGEKYGITVTVVPTVTARDAGETPVSSSAVRAAVAAGDMPAVRRMLGRGYCLRLPVSSGQHLARQWGMPTVNQILPPGLAHPRYGVYASSVEIGSETYIGVTNIGIHPTVGAAAPQAETYIEGFSGDLYGQTVAVYPVAFLRPELTFDTADALVRQIRQDAADAAAVFAPTGRIRAVLFDYDDTLHYRPPAFRRAVEQFIDDYYPDIPPEEREQRITEMILCNRCGYGMGMSYAEYIARFLHRWEAADALSPEEATDRFLMHFHGACRLLPDALDTIDGLRRRGLTVGVLSNGDSVLQNSKITRSGLRPHLDITVISGDEGIDKPDPAVFRRVAARLGVACADCVYVGDNPINDIAGALAAGMRAVRIDVGFPPGHPAYRDPIPDGVPTVHALGELPALLFPEE